MNLRIYRIPPPCRSCRGVALVLVLSVIAIISTLVLSFLMMVHTESRSGKAFSDTADARNLAELPVNLAIAQIRRATEQNGVDKAWCSQPGMLRVYGTESDTTTANSDSSYTRAKTIALYKLYSDDKMVVTNPSATSTSGGMTTQEVNAAIQTDVSDLANWQTTPGMYVDMNEPAPVALTGSDKVQIEFPISDPRAMFARNGGQPVDGYSVDATKVPGTQLPSSSSDLGARLPMPVRWLYLLSDGRLVAPTGGDSNGLKFQATDAPSSSNPIVGRIAFWTDDDSCKVNINTATEGRPWDTPRAHSQTEINFADRQPVQNEFSQYPGHPAQTCLSPVFQAFSSDWTVSPSMSDAAMQTALKHYFDFSPRIPWGGSMGATTAATAAIPTTSLKNARLFTSVDEMVFTRDRLPQNPVLDQQDVMIGRFFLTAQSRAPELSLFNKPRLMLWPLSSSTTQRNAEDKLLAFLGSTLGHPWPLVTRTTNWTSKDSPGSSTTGTQELSSGLANRNKDMYYGMLQPYLGAASKGKTFPVPGFGGTFEQKWGAHRRDQVLTEIWDFDRWSVNSYSTASGLSPSYYYLPPRSDPNLGETSATPTMVTDTKTRGFGRFPTITEATIVFVATAKDSSSKTTKMQAYLILEPFSPTCGPPSWTPNVRYKISGLDSFKADGNGMGFPGSATNHCTAACGWVDGGHSTPFNGIGHQFVRANTHPSGAGYGKALGTTDPDAQFPFYSTAVDVTGKTQFLFSGGSITIEVQTGWGSTGTTVQTLHMNFPAATLKVPTTATDPDIATRLNYTGTDYINRLIENGDTTRSVEIAANDPSSTPKNDNPAKGDLRILSLMSEVPATWFTTHPKYTDTTVQRLHFLRQGNSTAGGQYGPPDPAGASGPIGASYNNAHPNTSVTGGTLLKGADYGRDSPPGVPRGLLGAINADGRPGDFDNGTGIIEDGPYVNKADEGNIATADGGYMSRGSFNVENGSSYSPNRQITSAVAFGSLPTGVSSYDQAMNGPNSFRPWQTLLFCPNPASRDTVSTKEPTALDHEGFKSPRDHLLLDLFWMPIVEPYAISDTFSTAGKINMNYQMLPFSHIERSTGIYSAMKPVCLTAITPKSVRAVGTFDSGHQSGENYKEGTVHKYELRYLVNTKETLKGFQARFNMGDAFRSASEICEIFLVPQRMDGHTYNSDATMPPTYDGMTRWWNGDLNTVDAFDATGDNSREAPYNSLYPRLTTRSNTFTVHFRVQSLKKARSTPVNTWIEGKDAVLSEYRGSSTLERYMDPNDLQVTNIGMGYDTFNLTWDTLYRFRIVDRKRFAP